MIQADNNNRKVTAIGKAHYKNSDGRNVFGDKLIAYIGADGTLKTIDAYDNTKGHHSPRHRRNRRRAELYCQHINGQS